MRAPLVHAPKMKDRTLVFQLARLNEKSRRAAYPRMSCRKLSSVMPSIVSPDPDRVPSDWIGPAPPYSQPHQSSNERGRSPTSSVCDVPAAMSRTGSSTEIQHAVSCRKVRSRHAKVIGQGYVAGIPGKLRYLRTAVARRLAWRARCTAARESLPRMPTMPSVTSNSISVMLSCRRDMTEVPHRARCHNLRAASNTLEFRKRCGES